MELLNIKDGVLAPLNGFMTQTEYQSVVRRMLLPSGQPWTIPITLAIPLTISKQLRQGKTIGLVYDETIAAHMRVQSVFKVKQNDLGAIYKTTDPAHPGVDKELAKSPWRAGGKLIFNKHFKPQRHPSYKTPAQIRALMRRRRYGTMTGFQTRNIIHRAHEYLQRTALEITDALFIHPLIGWKKNDDASSEQIVAAYKVMLEHFYPAHRVLFSVLETPMRYAGPREAVFHALIRKNYGCTHFIVGRDHAGVNGYYGLYEAQNLCASIRNLGIQILALSGPFFCDGCGQITTEKSCGHYTQTPRLIRPISGTMIRKHLQEGRRPPEYALRPEIADAVLKTTARTPVA